VISVRTLSKQHGERKVLVGVSAEVTKGETIAIVGPSGGGKSTLLRCLNYLETFDAGEVEICGFKLRPHMVGGEARKTLRAMRTRVGMVFQQFNLFPHLTALQNIMLAPRVVKRVELAAAATKAQELLALVGLGDRGGAFPHE
jgi:polar amino acid transport system ATP-binding protein